MKIWWPPFITVGARESLSMIKRGKEFCIASIKIPWWHPKCYENLNAWYIRHCQMKNRWPVEWMVLDWETLIFGNNNVKSLRRNNGGSRLIWSLCFQVFVVVVFIDPVALRHLYQNCRSKTSVMVNIELKLVHNNVGVGNTWVFEFKNIFCSCFVELSFLQKNVIE